MNYIYDIVLNFQDNYYNFFEWNREDKIKNIIKIPLYRVSDKDINILKNNIIKVSKEFINKIKIDNKNYKKLICLVSNTKISLGLLFNEEGYLIKRSSLIFDEEEECIEVSKKLPVTNIEYIENKKVEYQNKLRIEKEKKKKLINYIKDNNNSTILKYLYYDYYQKEPNDINEIKKSLLRELNKEWNIKQNNLYKTINMFSKIKN
ncbi:MAG: hypothetical protein IJI49_04340 [Bacilli bacterium]|nr:hypothetical protein [Bacilli bacterium]